MHPPVQPILALDDSLVVKHVNEAFLRDFKVNAGETFKFYAVAIIGGFINISTATWIFGHPSGVFSANLWGSVIAPVSGIIAAFLWDFLGYKYFVFKRS